jgi:hypothetical protein
MCQRCRWQSTGKIIRKKRGHKYVSFAKKMIGKTAPPQDSKVLEIGPGPCKNVSWHSSFAVAFRSLLTPYCQHGVLAGGPSPHEGHAHAGCTQTNKADGK